MNLPCSKELEGSSFSEGWDDLVYIYTGLFILDGNGMSRETVLNDFAVLYKFSRMNRIKRWPRGLSLFLLVPFYCASSFDKDLKRFIWSSRGPGRWAVFMKPVLYNSENNSIIGMEALQNWNFKYFRALDLLYKDGIKKAARHFGHDPSMTRIVYPAED